MLSKLKDRIRKPATSDDVDRIKINKIAVERVAIEVDKTTQNLLRRDQELLKKFQNGVGH